MTSILTNTSAMTALQTLKSINSNLEKTQSEISTGKSVGNAKDNAAIWSISKVMESDTAGFKAIQDSLNLGDATLTVARNASESTADLLKEIKQKVVTAQESNVDRTKIQADIVQLRDQISSVVGAAQFNGLNLLNNTDSTAGSGTNEILASLDRDANGTVTSGTINVVKQDLGQSASAVNTMGTDAATSTAAVADGATAVIATFANAASGSVLAGMSFQANAGGLGLSAAVGYVARDGETLESVTSQIVARLNTQAASDDVNVTFATTSTAGEVEVTNNTGAASTALTAADFEQDDGTNLDGTIGGGLEALADIDVTSEAGAAGALAAIEGLIQTTIDSSAELGSSAKRVEIQADFVGKLTDSFKSGIGALVDADMEAASARLQALQTQQQLGIQALSIANSAPQNILSLFR